MRNKRHDIPVLSARARALLLLAIDKIEKTGLYNQDCTKFPHVVHSCPLEDSPLCIVGWMNALATALGLDSDGLTLEQYERLYWYRQWPKKFKVFGPYGGDRNSGQAITDIPASVGIARIKCFLKSGGTR